MAETKKIAVKTAQDEKAAKTESEKKEPEKANKESLYTVAELLEAPIYKTNKGKDIPRECVIAAFKGKKKEEKMTTDAARAVVKKFMGMEVK